MLSYEVDFKAPYKSVQMDYLTQKLWTYYKRVFEIAFQREFIKFLIPFALSN